MGQARFSLSLKQVLHPSSTSTAALAVLALFCSPASANVGEAYGFGSRTAALAGAGVAHGGDAYSAYSNPAAMAINKDKRLVISWGVMSMIPDFKDIGNVVISNDYVADEVKRGSVTTDDYRSAFGQSIGLSYKLFPEFQNLTLGLVSFLPLQQVAYLDSGEAFIPEYVLYRSRLQRPQFELGLGMGRAPLYFGAGIHLGFSLNGNATVFLQADPNRVSTMRFASSLKPKATPYLGLFLSPEDERFSFGSVLRFALSSPSNIKLQSGARFFGDLAALDFSLQSLATFYYDPMTLEVGGSWVYHPKARLFAQIDIQGWNMYEAPALSISDPNVNNCDTTSNTPGNCVNTISPSRNPEFDYKNIFIPRIAHELQLEGGIVLRFGYAYRPSFLKGLPTGAGNYLDPPKHMLNAGLGFGFNRFLSFDTPWKLDIHASYQQLKTQVINKTPGDENNAGTTDLKIGAPGYEAGGKIFGGGLSLTLAL